MAKTILAAPQQQQHAQYHLPAAIRAAILAQAPTPNGRVPDAALASLIERQRARFISLNGHDGLEQQPTT